MKNLKSSLTKKLSSIGILFLAFFFSLTNSAAAQTLEQRLQGIANAQDEEQLINAIIRFSVPAGALALIGLSISAVYTVITSQGNPEKLGEAREVFQNAILGFVLIVLAVSVLLIFESVTGIQI